MNWIHWLVWGFSGTVVLTSILAASQGFGMTRMNIPYLLGTIFTPSRDKAKFIGFFIHFANGWLFALVYVLAFHAFGLATWWFGAVIGLVQAIFVLTMRSEERRVGKVFRYRLLRMLYNIMMIVLQ